MSEGHPHDRPVYIESGYGLDYKNQRQAQADEDDGLLHRLDAEGPARGGKPVICSNASPLAAIETNGPVSDIPIRSKGESSTKPETGGSCRLRPAAPEHQITPQNST